MQGDHRGLRATGRAAAGVALREDDGSLRCFTPRALARLQAFPDTYALPRVWSTAVMQIGNACPPLLAERFTPAHSRPHWRERRPPRRLERVITHSDRHSSGAMSFRARSIPRTPPAPSGASIRVLKVGLERLTLYAPTEVVFGTEKFTWWIAPEESLERHQVSDGFWEANAATFATLAESLFIGTTFPLHKLPKKNFWERERRARVKMNAVMMMLYFQRKLKERASQVARSVLTAIGTSTVLASAGYSPEPWCLTKHQYHTAFMVPIHLWKCKIWHIVNKIFSGGGGLVYPNPFKVKELGSNAQKRLEELGEDVFSSEVENLKDESDLLCTESIDFQRPIVKKRLRDTPMGDLRDDFYTIDESEILLGEKDEFALRTGGGT